MIKQRHSTLSDEVGDCMPQNQFSPKMISTITHCVSVSAGRISSGALGNEFTIKTNTHAHTVGRLQQHNDVTPRHRLQADLRQTNKAASSILPITQTAAEQCQDISSRYYFLARVALEAEELMESLHSGIGSSSGGRRRRRRSVS